MGEEKENNKKVYNIVDSVKGGSGKTTFALMLSLLLDNELTKSRENNETSVCLIDMDIQGSALMYLLYGKSFLDGEKDKDKTERIAYLNDRVIAVGEESQAKRNYINPFCFDGNETSGPWTDVIFCDPRTDSKKKFRSMSNQNYSPEVLYSTYRMGLGNMLANLKKTKPYLHKHVVFDMPPNADGYSDAVYDVMLKKEYSVMRRGDKCNLFLLSTLDMGQLSATLDYFFEVTSSENFQKINKIFFVFNDWCGFKKIPAQEDDERLFFDAVSYVKEQMRKATATCKIKTWKKVFFVGLRFDNLYYRMCTFGDGIKNKTMPTVFLKPVKYITNMNDDLTTEKNRDKTELLLKLLDLKKD